MYVKQAIIILISFKITYLQTNDLVNILVTENNFFHKINLQLHILTNKIFNSFNLGQEFTKKPKTKGLLTMHSDLINIAEKHSSVYDDIKIITNLKETDLTGLEKIFEDIINEETNQLKNTIIKKFTDTTGIYNNTFNLDTGTFVNELLSKVLKLTDKDIVKVSNETRDIKINGKPATSQLNRREIKAWQPLTSGKDRDKCNKTRRIYKGKNTRIKRYPFIASIHVMNQFMCAGSIVSKDLVITAATCLQIAYYNSTYRINSISVRIGSDYTNRNGEMIPVTKIICHPGYDPASLKNNVAIVRIKKRIKFSKKRRIQRIKYNRKEDFLDSDNRVTILGWGAKDANHENSKTHKLSIAHLDIYDIDECKEIYSRLYVTDKNFCAGFVSKGGGACNRDVGGPCIASGELIGIISFGPLICGAIDAPTVLTRLSYYADWIDDIIRQKPLTSDTKKTAPKKPSRALLSPVLTSSPTRPVTENSDLRTGTTELIYTDEIIILKGILQEIALSNNSIIDYIIYGDTESNENEAKNILTTTEKEEVPHQPELNERNIKIERKNKPLPGRMQKLIKQTADVDFSDLSNSYEETDTAVKILESLVGYTSFKEKSTTPKRFHMKDKNDLEHKGTLKIIKESVYAERSDLNNGQQSVASDSSWYYEEDEIGISIERTKAPNAKVSGVSHNHHDTYFNKATTRKSAFNSDGLQFENYDNIIFNQNPLRESRSFLKTNNEHEKAIKRLDHRNKNRSIKSDYEDKQNGDSNDDITVNQRMKTSDEILIGVATSISDDDYENDEKIDKQEYDNNMRSKADNDSTLLWRFRKLG